MRTDNPRFLERLPIGEAQPYGTLLITLVLCALGFVIRTAVDPVLPPGFPYLTFFPVVIITSFLFGARRGVIAALICGLLAWYSFIPPFGSFALQGGTMTALIFYLFVCGTDIALVHWMQRANAGLARERERNGRLADTRELLFRELQHRVSNNLQVVAGLLTLQKRRVADPDARLALDEAVRRLGTVGRISRQLYDPTGDGRDLASFLELLVADVVEASGRTDIAHRVSCPAGLRIGPDRAVPVALIVSEAVANAIEHGFAARGGTVEVEVARDHAEGWLRVMVMDDGGALPADFDAAANPSLGLTIATSLAAQIGGEFGLHGGPRTTALLRMPG